MNEVRIVFFFLVSSVTWPHMDVCFEKILGKPMSMRNALALASNTPE